MPTVIRNGKEEKTMLLEKILKENEKATRLNYIVIGLQLITILIALLSFVRL